MTWKLWTAVLLLGIISGIGIAAWRIAGIEKSPAYRVYGSWRGTTDLALNKDDLVTTQVTLFALFALPSQEAVYLFASSDENQKRLNGNNNYTIEGNIHNIKAEYWSITAYGRDLYLIPNQANRYSFNRDNLKTDSLGNFKIVMSSTSTSGNWLPVQNGKKFELVLRLYDGEKDFMEHLDKATLPYIKRI
jgi:hypothetical protein